MRYTTVIDISKAPWYRNHNIRLVYLHLVLDSGYHDSDRDIYPSSIRSLAMDAGVSVSAARHALATLERDGLVSRESGLLKVKKWIPSDDLKITARPKTKAAQKDADVAKERRQRDEERERHAEALAEQRERLRTEGKDNFMIYYEQKLKEAAQGDLEASAAVRRYAAIYEQHKQQHQQNQTKK